MAYDDQEAVQAVVSSFQQVLNELGVENADLTEEAARVASNLAIAVEVRRLEPLLATLGMGALTDKLGRAASGQSAQPEPPAQPPPASSGRFHDSRVQLALGMNEPAIEVYCEDCKARKGEECK